VNGTVAGEPPAPTHAKSGLEARGEPKARLRLYVGGRVEAKLDSPPALSGINPLGREGLSSFASTLSPT